MSWSEELEPGSEGEEETCEHSEVFGAQEPGQMRPPVQGWQPAAVLVCWGLAELLSRPAAAGLKTPGWSGFRRPGCAAGAGSAGSAAVEPSSQRI